MSVRFVASLIAAAAVLASIPRAHGQAAPAQPTSVPGLPGLPAPLDGFATKYAKLTAEQVAALGRGQPITKLLDTDPAHEVAVFGAVWVNGPLEKYVAAVKDIERFESGGSFRVTKKVSSPPRLQDFDQLTIPSEDAEDLRSCTVGSCQLKLDQPAIDRMRKEVDWKKPTARADVDRIARSIAFEYVNGYLEGGNEKLAVYRDAEHPTFVAQEFSSMIDRLPAFGEFLPGLRKYLLDFPHAPLPDSESFIYWQEAQFGLKPTIRINHLVTAAVPGGSVIASKMIYATHYFWTALELRFLARDTSRGSGFWFVSVNRSRSDGLTGFVGRMIRGKVRGEAEKGMLAVLNLTKETFK